jgi:hypothetical protein
MVNNMSSNYSALNFNNLSTDEPITLQWCIDNWLLKKVDVIDFTSSDYSVDNSKRVVFCQKCTKSFTINANLKNGGRPRMFFRHLLANHLKPNVTPTTENLERTITENVEHDSDSVNRKRPHSTNRSQLSSSSSDDEDLEPVDKLPKNC